MIIDEIATLLQQSGVGTVGTNIYIGQLPQDVEDAIMLLAVPSPEPDKYTGIEYQDFDIWARFKTTDDAYNKLHEIFLLLDRRDAYTLPSYEVYFIHALGRIEDLDRDIEQRKLLKLSFRAIYRNLDLVS